MISRKTAPLIAWLLAGCGTTHLPFFGDDKDIEPAAQAGPVATLYCYETLADSSCYLVPELKRPDRFLASTTIHRSRLAPGLDVAGD